MQKSGTEEKANGTTREERNAVGRGRVERSRVPKCRQQKESSFWRARGLVMPQSTGRANQSVMPTWLTPNDPTPTPPPNLTQSVPTMLNLV